MVTNPLACHFAFVTDSVGNQNLYVSGILPIDTRSCHSVVTKGHSALNETMNDSQMAKNDFVSI